MAARASNVGSLAERALRRIGATSRLDRPARRLQDAVGKHLGRGGRSDALRGTWLGHALHPLLTDFTNGPWMAASFLDLFGPRGSAPAARRLVGFGLVAAAPTLLSGLVDWQQTTEAQRRVGLVHATSSSFATLLYAGSFLARCAGNHRRGVALGLAGGIVAFADGYVGGDLTLVSGVGRGRRRASSS